MDSKEINQLEWAMKPQAQKMFGRLLKSGVEAALAVELLELEFGEENIWVLDEDES